MCSRTMIRISRKMLRMKGAQMRVRAHRMISRPVLCELWIEPGISNCVRLEWYKRSIVIVRAIRTLATESRSSRTVWVIRKSDDGRWTLSKRINVL